MPDLLCTPFPHSVCTLPLLSSLPLYPVVPPQPKNRGEERKRRRKKREKSKTRLHCQSLPWYGGLPGLSWPVRPSLGNPAAQNGAEWAKPVPTGLGKEVLSAQANYTCGIWAADCPVTPYLMRKRQPKQLFKTKCHRGISFAGSWPVRDCFSHSLSHLAQECGLGRPAVGGRTRQGGGKEQAGRSLPGVRPVPPRHGPARRPDRLTFLFTKPTS